MWNLLEQLDCIFSFLGFSEKLYEPITELELEKRTEDLPVQFPEHLTALYKWHNGNFENFFPGYEFLSLQEAISHFNGLIELANELQEDEFYKNSYFPIFRYQDSYFVVDCDSCSTGGIYWVWVEGGDKPVKMYDSLDQMLQVIVDSYLCGAFYIEDEFLDENRVLFEKVRKKHLSVELLHKEEDDWKSITNEAKDFRSLLDQKDFVRRLYETYDERAIPYLQDLLGNSNPDIISAAAFGLGELKSRESLPELLKLLEHPEEKVRNLCTSAIADIICPTDSLLLQPILNKLVDESTLVRIHAIEALGRIRSSKATPILIQTLKQSKSNIRIHVIEAMGKIGDSECLDAVKALREEGLEGLELQVAERVISYIEKKTVGCAPCCNASDPLIYFWDSTYHAHKFLEAIDNAPAPAA
ncbi:MAG: hypothetical protein F6K00_28880 [Leptolyngbya sp. SIOISBB]|nr:hypothetical protein [Leptolyngbya sp. SIOISBB]